MQLGMHPATHNQDPPLAPYPLAARQQIMQTLCKHQWDSVPIVVPILSIPHNRKQMNAKNKNLIMLIVKMLPKQHFYTFLYR